MIVRADLPRGVQAAMLVHAAGESSPGNLSDGTYAVVLEVPDEPALRRASMWLEARGVRFTPVHEPDAPYSGQMMAIGLEPRRKEELRKHMSSFRLLR